jgi:hypothetical protein
MEPQRFKFEDDFIEDNVRCIPMLVRFKLDAAGIKLKLAEWSRFKVDERNQLIKLPCSTREQVIAYRNYLYQLVMMRAGNEPTPLTLDGNPAWADLEKIDVSLQEKAKEYNWNISIEQWKGLNNLQRFALLKLYRPGHENKNFPKAMKEFGLI